MLICMEFVARSRILPGHRHIACIECLAEADRTELARAVDIMVMRSPSCCLFRVRSHPEDHHLCRTKHHLPHSGAKSNCGEF